MGLFGGVANVISGRRNAKEGSAMYDAGLGERDGLMNNRKGLADSAILEENAAIARDAMGKSLIKDGMEDVAARKYGLNQKAITKYASDANAGLEALMGANQTYGGDLDSAAVAGAQEMINNRKDYFDQNTALENFRQNQWYVNVEQPFLQRLQFANDKVGLGLNQKLAGRNQSAAGFGQIGDGLLDIGATALTAGMGGGSGAGLRGLFGKKSPVDYNAAQGWFGG